ncbi:MAG: dihydropteroate synthase [Candidatus Coatesbacteria bacterium]|nr:dihydropteroate synthase [Candidatus Coatesbacteria bacterium]
MSATRCSGLATVVVSGTGSEVAIGAENEFAIIGERVNPTNRAALTRSIRDGSFDVALALAKTQIEAGASVIDVNVGAVGVDEPHVLPDLVSFLQEHIEIPLSLDSASVEALESAVAVYKGRPVVNSTTGAAERLSRLLALTKSCDGALIALLMDEKGVPDDVDGRLRIAERILNEASKAGLSHSNVLIDSIVMSVGASPAAGRTTLLTLRRVVQEFGAATVLGVSNVSHGMPGRSILNRAMLSIAVFEGLSSAIVDPMDAGMKDAIAACRLLSGRDETGMGYVQHCRRTGGQ